MIRRHELSDAEWEFVRPLLPQSLRGRKRLDDRRVLNGIVWRCRSIQRSSELTSMRRGREKAPRPGPRPVQRRPDQQDPPGLRRPGPAARLRRHGRQHQRLHPLHRRDGGDPGAPARTRPSPRSARSRPRATRATARKRSAPGSAVGASPTRSSSGPTRSATGPAAAAAVAARRPSTARHTSTATSSNGASTASSSGAALPPATTNPPSPTKQPSPSHHS